jgi:hypothetical protein
MEAVTAQKDGGRPSRRGTGSWILILGLVFFAMVGLQLLGELTTRKSIGMRIQCRANLRMLTDAKARWARDNGMSSNAVPTEADLIGEEKYIGGAAELTPWER